jgi:hypothetical protein
MDKATVTIAASLWQIFSRFGFPKILQSDGDATMVTDIIKEMKHTHGGEHRGVTAYNPRSMGKVEPQTHVSLWRDRRTGLSSLRPLSYV